MSQLNEKSNRNYYRKINFSLTRIKQNRKVRWDFEKNTVSIINHTELQMTSKGNAVNSSRSKIPSDPDLSLQDYFTKMHFHFYLQGRKLETKTNRLSQFP